MLSVAGKREARAPREARRDIVAIDAVAALRHGFVPRHQPRGRPARFEKPRGKGALGDLGHGSGRPLPRCGVDHALGGDHLVAQHQPCGHVIVPFDETCHRPDGGEDGLVERPDGVFHRRVMTVDEEARAEVIHRFAMAVKVDFAHGFERETRDIGVGIEIMVRRGDEDVIDVEQQVAAGPPCDLGQKGRFLDRAFREEQVGGGARAASGSPAPLAPRRCGWRHGTVFLRVGQRQEIVEEDAVMGRPGRCAEKLSGW